MGITEILNVFAIGIINQNPAYIYSVQKQSNHLRYNYYLLISDEEDSPTIFEVGNTMPTLQKLNITLEPIIPENPQYFDFLSRREMAIMKIQPQQKAEDNIYDLNILLTKNRNS